MTTLHRRSILWLAIVPFTFFWLCTLNVFGPPPLHNLAPIWVVIGTVLTVFAQRKERIVIDRRFALAIIPLIVSSLLLPYPYNIGLMVMIIGLAGIAFIPQLPMIWPGFLTAGFILMLQAMVLPFYYAFIPSNHQAAWFAPLIYLFARISGLNSSLTDGVIFIQESLRTYPFPITWDKLGLYPFILILTPALFLITAYTQHLKKRLYSLLGVIVLSTLYLAVRVLVLIHFFFATEVTGVNTMNEMRALFFNPVWLLVSFIPLVLLVMKFYSLDTEKRDKKSFIFSMNKRFIIASAMIFLGFFCLVEACIFQDPGKEKEGKILIDELHGSWETSTLQLDKKWYGQMSTYNAYSMVEWLKDHFEVDRVMSPLYLEWKVPAEVTKVKPDITEDKLTFELLSKYDILIVKTPSRYKPEEIMAVKDFVVKGGGLFLIGDHSNFCGTSVALNEIGQNFGIEFEFNSIHAANGRLSIYERGIVPHPCLKYMPRFDFMTSCSISVPITGEYIIPGYGLMAEPGEYASAGFFRNTRPNTPTLITDMNWGIFHQAVALKYGRGRIVAFADSTTISNFRIFFGGSPNLVIGCIEYLNRSNTCGYAKPLFWIIGTLSILVVIYLLKKETVIMILFVIITFGIPSISLGLWIYSFSAAMKDSVPAKYFMKDHTVCFDGQHSCNIAGDEDMEINNYTTFFIWTQRVGLTPAIESLEKCMEKGKMMVIIDPIKNFSKKELTAIKKYVENGGKVLLMLDNTTREHTGELLKLFGMDLKKISGVREKETQIKMISTEQVNFPIIPWGLSITGGEALRAAGNRTVLSYVSYGKGNFVVFTASSVFKNGYNGEPGYMGNSGSDPESAELSYNLRTLYDLEYYIFEEIMKISNNTDINHF